jgi:hypothetical protein
MITSIAVLAVLFFFGCLYLAHRLDVVNNSYATLHTAIEQEVAGPNYDYDDYSDLIDDECDPLDRVFTPSEEFLMKQFPNMDVAGAFLDSDGECYFVWELSTMLGTASVTIDEKFDPPMVTAMIYKADIEFTFTIDVLGGLRAIAKPCKHCKHCGFTGKALPVDGDEYW